MEHQQTEFSKGEYHTILESTVGSTLHGTSVPDGLEDLDIMAVVLEPKHRVLGFHPKDTWVKRTKPDGVRSEAGDIDYTAYGLKKFLQLALKGNPTLLLSLFTPTEFVRTITPQGTALQGLYPSIVSKEVYAPFRGYMKQQLERLLGTRGQMNVTRPELIEAYGFDTKYAGHIIRLGLQGKEVLSTGKITLPMPQTDRELVLAVRTGKFSLEDVIKLAAEVENELDLAYNNSPLPDKPDYIKVETWMMETYLKHWSRT